MGLSENFGFLDNVLNLLICESLKEIGEMACDTNGLVLSWTDSYRWLIHQSLITGVISKRTIAEQVQQLLQDVWNIPFSKNPISARKVDKYFT